MKLNIIKTIIPLTAIALSGLMTSCMKDLNVDGPEDCADPRIDLSFTPSQMYTKCYASMIMEGNDGSADFDIDDAGKSTLVRNIYNLECLSTDEAICWWTDGGLVNVGYNQPSAEDQLLRFMYYRVMSNITYCNHYINNEQCQALGADKLAEIRWIRAFNYYTLANEFGNIPFTTAITSEAPEQASRETMYAWLIDELTNNVLPNLMDAKAKSSTDANYGRIDKAAAWILLSRLYLNANVWNADNKDWTDAKYNEALTKSAEYAKMVIDSDYGLSTEGSTVTVDGIQCNYTGYDKLFMADNGESSAHVEAILPLLQDGKTTQGWGGTMYFIAAHWDTNMKTVAGLSAGTTAVDWSGNRVRQQLLEKFTSDPSQWVGKTAKEIRAMAGDDRALFWGVDKTLSLGDNSSFDQGLATVKWNNRRSDGKDANDTYAVDGDFLLLRTAEAYLNYAEAEARLNGGKVAASSEAGKCITALRDRAHCTKTMTAYSLDDILDERAREFYCEGYRRTDLIRFGQYGGNQATYQWERKNGTNPGTNFDSHFNIYPLPATELLANDKLTQNPGYTK